MMRTLTKWLLRNCKWFFAVWPLLIGPAEISGQIFSSRQLLNFAVQIPEIALIDIEPGGAVNINLALSSPTEAGREMNTAIASDNSLWLNYSSSLTAGRTTTRKVNVQISGGVVPVGASIRLSASPFSGSGKGTLGQPSGTITLSNSPQTLISGIGGCFTGDGINNGHQLNFSLVVSDYSLLDLAQSSTLQLTYTITDN